MSRNVCTPVTVFQSSPVPKDGRYAINPPVSRQTHVSILARPEGRALPRRARQCDGGGAVSILARPEGRALPGVGRFGDGARPVSILARPEGRALPHYLTKA